MTSGQQKQAKRRKRAKSRKRQSGALAAHRAFAPLLGLWGAALGGLPVMVLPPALIDGAIAGTTLALLNGTAQAVIAGLAAAVLGGGLFVVAAPMSDRARRQTKAPSIAAMATRRVRPINSPIDPPIDPARDLGSRSLDDPIETMPFASPAWRDASEHEPAPQPVPEPASVPAVRAVPDPAPSAPRELDLAAFAVLPGRNAVWVEDVPVPAPAIPAQPAPSAPLTSVPVQAPGTAALTRLRAVPPSELSLVQMVERFAGALHEHRDNAPAHALTGAELAAREAALAEALKALAALSGDHAAGGAGAEQSGGGPESLRSALARLQTPRVLGRGAA